MMPAPKGPDTAPRPDVRRPDLGALADDPEALGRAMEACRRYLLLVANKEIAPVLKPKGGASDIVQETFLEAHRDLGTFSGRSERELRCWLIRIFRNNLANFIRRYRSTIRRQIGREVSLDHDRSDGATQDGLAASTLSPSGQAILGEQAACLERALDRLPERDRKVLIWRGHDNCPWDEVGRRLGGSPDKARKIWSRAINRLRAEIGDAPSEPPDSPA